MAFQKVSDLSTETVVKLGGLNSKTGKPNPDKMEGYYLGSRTVKSETGESVIHIFQTPVGNQGVWGTADLNTKLAQINPGTMVLAKYKEKRKLAAGKTKHVYDVMFDADNSITVAGTSSLASSVDNTEVDYEDTTYAQQLTDGSEEDDDQDAQLQALEAARRQAQAEKVKALLNKNKKA